MLGTPPCRKFGRAALPRCWDDGSLNTRYVPGQNFLDSQPIWTIFGALESTGSLLSKTPKIIEIGSEVVKLWSKMSKKREKCNFTVILTLFTNFEIPPIIEEYSARIDKIGLRWFGVIPVKLWSRNVSKTRKRDFTGVLALFTKFRYFFNLEKI